MCVMHLHYVFQKIELKNGMQYLSTAYETAYRVCIVDKKRMMPLNNLNFLIESANFHFRNLLLYLQIS